MKVYDKRYDFNFPIENFLFIFSNMVPMMGTAEEMKELISKGTFMAFENRVYLAGACNVGKSTLASILLGEEIPQRWKSTNGLVTSICQISHDITQ
jgi:ribosome biogenesis GTPase A